MTTTATDPAVDPTPAAVRAPSPRRRRRLAATALWVPLVLGLGVWLVVGMRPDLSSGYAEGPGPGGRIENGDVTGLSAGHAWFVDRRSGWFATAVRNGGRTPVTLRGGHSDGLLVRDVRFTRVLDHSYVPVEPYTDRVTLQPGEEVMIRVDLDTGCAGVSQNVGLSTDGVDLEATTWGVIRKVHLDTMYAYGFFGDRGVPPLTGPGCDQ